MDRPGHFKTSPVVPPGVQSLKIYWERSVDVVQPDNGAVAQSEGFSPVGRRRNFHHIYRRFFVQVYGVQDSHRGKSATKTAAYTATCL